MKKIKIIYSNKGRMYSDFEVEYLIRGLIDDFNKNDNSFEITTATENVLTVIRLLVAEGKLNKEHVEIMYGDMVYHLDKYGAYEDVVTIEKLQSSLLTRILEENFKMEERK